jgi:HK97 family phage portal protein
VAVNILDQVRNFLTAPKLDEALGALAHNPPTPPIRTSWVWDSHITESAGGGGKGKLPQSVSLSWDENEARGIESSMRSWQGLTPRERKEILLAIYLANPWVSACADVIATRICSGGFTVEKVSEETEDNNEHHDQLMNFCLRINDDWDFLQYARASILDELIFGETYTEIVWKDGVPFQLYKVDCVTMGYKVARTGQIIRYEQQLTSTSEKNFLDPKDIIRWWFPHPHAAADPFSPIEKVQDAVNLDKKMVNWTTTFFQKGAKWPSYTKFPGDEHEATRFLEWQRENYTGEKNAHLPPVVWGDADIIPLGKGSMDIDFPGGRDRNRTEVLSAYHVPPAPVGIIESGNIGGGTGEDQDKGLQYNACDPVKHAYLEKLNYRVSKRGFNIHDYRIGLRYADYRNDESLATVQDKHIRNGSITINEARAESGKRPYKDGGDTPIVVASKDVFPVPRLDDMAVEQSQSAQLDIEAKQVANEKAKNPPEPTLLPGQTNQPGKPNQNKGTNNISSKKTPGKQQAKESLMEQLDMTPEQLAHFFHDTYEKLAPDFRYQTRKSSAVAWKDVPENNKNLMIAVAGEVLKKLDKESHAQETTQSPAHQQSHARLTLLSQGTDTQEGTTETGEVRGATTASNCMV